MSYLTEQEIEALQSSGLHRKGPYLIQCMTHTILSIARHYGGVKISGEHYMYIPATDELIRDDVQKWIAKRRKAEKKGAVTG